MEEKILYLINEVAADKSTKDKVTVLPLMCGAGKSTAVSQKMREVIQADNGEGLLVLTDNIKRLHSYMNPADEELRAFLNDNRDKIAIVHTGHFRDEDPKHKPVLLMTTQHFCTAFPDRVAEHMEWKYHDESTQRTLVIVDEYPMFWEQRTITLKRLCEITGIIRTMGDYISEEDKVWCVRYWEGLIDRFESKLKVFRKIDEKNKGLKYHLFYEPIEEYSKEDLKFLIHLGVACEHASYADDLVAAFHTILDFYSIYLNWGVYCGQKNQSGNYCEVVQVPVSRMKRYEECGQKVIVLDGTGNILPLYTREEIDVRDCSAFDRDLSNMTIRHCCILTSRRSEQEKEQSESIRNAIVRDIQKRADNPLLFLNMGVEKEYSDRFVDARGRNRCSTAHFGNIAGKNDYRQYHDIFQIGLFRYPPVYYVTLLLDVVAYPSGALSRIASIQDEEGRYNALKQWLDSKKDELMEITNKSLLADIEQNVFRGSIREAQNKSEYHYYLYFDKLKGLPEMIRDHFGRHNAKFEQYHIIVEGGKESKGKRVLAWIDQRRENGDESVFTRRNLCKGVGLTEQQLRNLLLKDKEVATILKGLEVGKHKPQQYRINVEQDFSYI